MRRQNVPQLSRQWRYHRSNQRLFKTGQPEWLDSVTLDTNTCDWVIAACSLESYVGLQHHIFVSFCVNKQSSVMVGVIVKAVLHNLWKSGRSLYNLLLTDQVLAGDNCGEAAYSVMQCFVMSNSISILCKNYWVIHLMCCIIHELWKKQTCLHLWTSRIARRFVACDNVQKNFKQMRFSHIVLVSHIHRRQLILSCVWKYVWNPCPVI